MKNYFKVTKAGPGRYRIYDPLGVHMDLFTGRDKALLFDTGFGLADLKSTVRQITDLPLYVVNSHGHMDHACGNYQFEEKIYIHPDDMEVCKRHHTEDWKRLVLNHAKTATDFFTGEPVRPLTKDFDEKLYLERPVGNLQLIREGYIFDLGGLCLEVVELPGHTTGSIGLMDLDQRRLYAADAANNNVWLFLEEATSLSVYRKTLDKIWGMDFDRLIISHFPDPLEKSVIKDYMYMADHLDYSKGLPFAAPLAPETDALLCIRDGYSADDMMKPGFASIVISKDKL